MPSCVETVSKKIAVSQVRELALWITHGLYLQNYYSTPGV
jgi:hypothetical protein